MTSPTRRAAVASHSLLATGLLAAIVALVALACTASPGASAGGGLVTDQPSRSNPVPPSNDAGGEVPEAILAQVREQLALVAGGDVSAARIVSVEAVEWNDGSLGCPQPGMVYTQALVSGYRIVIDLGGREYDFRAPERGAPVLCEDGP